MEQGKISESQMGNESSLVDIVFSWSLEDILNDQLYKYKVCKPPNFISLNYTLNWVLVFSCSYVETNYLHILN